MVAISGCTQLLLKSTIGSSGLAPTVTYVGQSPGVSPSTPWPVVDSRTQPFLLWHHGLLLGFGALLALLGLLGLVFRAVSRPLLAQSLRGLSTITSSCLVLPLFLNVGLVCAAYLPRSLTA